MITATLSSAAARTFTWSEISKSNDVIEDFEWNGMTLNIAVSTEADRTTVRSKNGNEDVLDEIPAAYHVTAAIAIDEDANELDVTSAFLLDDKAVAAALVEANRQIQRRY